MEQQIIKIRLRKNGMYHQGDLRRLRETPGRILDAQFPPDPKGRVVVTLEQRQTDPSGVDWKAALSSDMAVRPVTFHP